MRRDAVGLAHMVIEGEVDALGVGKVGGDIPAGDPDFSFLHVPGMDEVDLVDHYQFLEQDGAYQAVEVAPGH